MTQLAERSVALAPDPRFALLDDAAGIVSVYLCPQRWAMDRRLADGKLDLLVERARAWRAVDRRALHAGLPAIRAAFDALADEAAAAGAHGIAAFFGIASGDERHVLLASSVACSVSVDRHAQIGQLVRAAQASRPIGLLDAAGAPVGEVRGELAVSAPANGGVDWEFALTPTATIASPGCDVVSVDGPVVAGAGRLSGPAHAAIFRERRRRQTALLDAVIADVRDGDEAVVGLPAVASALATDAVETLLLTDPAPAPRSPAAIVAWPQAAERLVRRACDRQVEVVVLSECPALRAPRGFDGVAARLRPRA